MKGKNAVALKVATTEVHRWLEIKRIRTKKQEQNKDTIDNLIDAFMDGTLSLDENGTITMQLAFGVGEGDAIVKLDFKPRITVGEIHSAMSGIASTDPDARILAYIATLTSSPPAVIRKLDTEDYGVASSIVVFFF